MRRGLFLTSLTRDQESAGLRIYSRYRRIRFEMDMSDMHEDDVNRDIHPP